MLTSLISVLNPNNTAVSINPTATTPASVAFSGASSTSMMTTSSMSTTPTSSAMQAGAAQAMQTRAVGMGALFGGAAMLLGNL
jgi:hypothetical protein